MTRNLSRVFSITVLLLALAAASYAQIGVGIAVSFGPPPLPVYAQPLCPGDGYIWTPGYWAWDPNVGDYFWVPGTWVLAPTVGFLWTPGWWGWGNGGYFFHAGYWGPQVGFYGGINYGYGYFGQGYEGGHWDHDRFFYNRAVNNVNVTVVHNVYNTTVVNRNDNHVSYNGGNGGITARPTSREEAAARERHVPPVAAQTQHVEAARSNQELRASVNHGKPPVAATPKPAEFKGAGVVPAKAAGGTYTPPPNRAAAQPRPNAQPARPENNPETARQQNNVPRPPENNAQPARPENNPQTARQQNNAPKPAVHPNDLPPIERSAVPDTGNAEMNQKYQQQQEQLRAQQTQERQQLQQKQEQEHQQMAQQKANQEKQQQLEQQHQQQTQQLQQQHQQQQQAMARQQQQQQQARQQPQHPNESKRPPQQ